MTTPTPTLNLTEIKAALNAILPGPWKYDADLRTVWASMPEPNEPSNALGRVCDASQRWAYHDPAQEATIRANLEFIAKAREWVPALVAEVERLRALKQETIVDLERIKKFMDPSPLPTRPIYDENNTPESIKL